jgi:hypothetical protein
VEETVYFRCFGGFAAKTTEKDSQLPCCRRPKKPLRLEQQRRLRKSWQMMGA